MKRWRIVEVENGTDADLTSSEVIGISVLLTHCSGEPRNYYNVYWRARQKIQPMIEGAFGDD